MQFNFNIGGVKVAYQTHSGAVRETLIFTRSEYSYIESNHTLIEATQTNRKATPCN
jgi:hypothetical protein